MLRNVVPRQGTETIYSLLPGIVENSLRNVVPRQGTETLAESRITYRECLRNVVPRQGTETEVYAYKSSNEY